MNERREHEAFLNAIIDNPNDDLPRLVFADYLEETGDSARAEFIRVQCELAGGVADTGRKTALEEREKELLSQHLEVWRVPIRGHQKFQRGFVDSLWASADNLLQASSEIVTSSTLRTLRITNADQRIDDLAEYPGFSHIEHLDLTNNNLSGDYRLRAILGNKTLTQIRGLNLHNNRIWADDVLRIARSPIATQLTHLDLSGNGIGTDGVANLTNETFAGLEELNLRSDGLPEYESLDVEAMTALSQAMFRRLKRLNLSGHVIGDWGFHKLCVASKRWKLGELNVSQNHLGTAGGLSMALPPIEHGCTLSIIDYSDNELEHSDAEYLLQWLPLDQMKEFRLAKSAVDEATLKLLLASRYAAKFHLNGDAP